MRTEPDAQAAGRLSVAVWEVMAQRGIEGASVRAVAEAAGCTTGLIMHHFGSRAAMLVHARQLLFGRTTERANAAEDAGTDPVARLTAVLEGALPLDEERAAEIRVWLGFAAAAVADPELAAVHVAGNRDWVGRIARLLAACVPDIDDEHRLRVGAIRLVALTDGLPTLSILDPQTYDKDMQNAALRDAIDSVVRDLKESR
ncbi:TetR/AcrR family transcriptional regulator [Nocardioides sp. NPDC087217]|uniref:TetR/AcrR family transcriptional regulator n=1 Tax=Nocardioides sp. NPDC087217 TaxID=3364335 RepID=UPI0037FB2A02